MKPDSILRHPAKRSYLDVVNNTRKNPLDGDDTRDTVFKQHPSLLLKLRNVANACKSKNI